MDTPGPPSVDLNPPAPWGAVLDANPDLVALLDAHGRIVWVNAGFERVSGWAAGTAKGRFLPELFGESTAWAPIDACLRRGKPVAPLELPWKHLDGTVRAGRVSVQVMAVGAGHGFHSLLTLQEMDRQHNELRIAIELANVAIWRHDLTTNRIHYNDLALRVLGLPPHPDGLSLDEVRMLIHPDDLPRVVAAAERALDSQRPVDMEARYRHPAGGWIHVLTRRVLRRDRQGRPLEFIGVALDVTEQVAKLRQAAELTNRLESAASAAGVGIWSVDLQTMQTEWNATMYAITGQPPHSKPPTSEQWMNQVIHPDDRPMMQKGRAELFASENISLEFQYRILRPDGNVRWLVNRARHEKRDGRAVLFGLAMDVTDRVTAETALRAAHERVALAARSVGMGTWEWNLETGAMLWDEYMFRLRNLEPRDRAPSEEERLAITHPDDAERVRALAYKAAADSASASYEFRVIWPDGTVHWLASRCTPVTDADGKGRRLIGVNWDVTDAKNTQIRRQEHELAQRESKAKSEFLSRMSHELRTPLNAVLGFAQLLQLDGASLTDVQRNQLRHIHAAGDHLLSLINDVLDLSSLQSGQLKLELRPVPLQDVLFEALPLVEVMARAQQVTVTAAALDGILHADRTRMRQVMINLLSNGIKYTPAGGRVTVSCELDATHVLLRVQDTGRGMTPEQLAHLFEPFNRLGVESQGIEGSGIGLALVKILVEGMHGSISVTSRPQLGSTFEVKLPRWVAEAPPVPVQEAKSAERIPASEIGAPRAGSLLYIEDNPVNVLLVEQLVRTRVGLSIASEVTGQAGVDCARRLQPDLILIDIQLPDMDGLEVLRRLRLHPETADTPCIALSANALPEDIERALSAGFSDYWTKPINFGPFLATLDRMFPGTGAASATVPHASP
jgi:PAS domain S-box-containing protein